MFKQVQMIDVNDFNDLVQKVYSRPYNFQQQDGCKERGIVQVAVPVEGPWDYENDTIPEEVNGEEMGVSFKVWLARDPKQKLNSDSLNRPHGLGLFWDRNFYPCIDMLLNDLHNKGHIPAGDYVINIDW